MHVLTFLKVLLLVHHARDWVSFFCMAGPGRAFAKVDLRAGSLGALLGGHFDHLMIGAV